MEKFFNEPPPTEKLLGQTDNKSIRLVIVRDGDLQRSMRRSLQPFRKFVFDVAVNLLENFSESDDGQSLKGRRINAYPNCQPILDLQRDTRRRRSKGDVQDITGSIVAVVHSIEFEFLN